MIHSKIKFRDKEDIMRLRGYVMVMLVGFLLVVSDSVYAFEEWNYGSTSGMQTFEANLSGEYRIEVWGSQGGGNGGKGGYVSVKTSLLKGDVLNIFVGNTSGYNGGGGGSAVGGGATDVRLNGLSLSDRLVVGAGGGGGIGGTDGGTGNGAGGASVGSSAGIAGSNGGGGGRSYDYTYDTGYWQDTGYWETYYDGSYEVTSSSYSLSGWNCSGLLSDGTYSCWRYTPKSRWVSTGQQFVKTGTATQSGLPGNGGSNFVKSGLVVESTQSGVNVSNGRVKITQLVVPPTLEFGSVGTEYKRSIVVTFNVTKGTNDVAYYILPDGTRVNGQLSGTFTVVDDGTYAVRVVDVQGYETTKSIVINRIDRDGPSGNISLSSSMWGGSNDKPIDVLITGIVDSRIGIKDVVTPRGVVDLTGKTSYTYRVDQNGVLSFVLRDKLGNETVKTISVTNFDGVVPVMDLSFNGKLNTPYRSFDMLVNATDGLSGLDYVDYQFYSGVSPVIGNYKRLTDLTKKLESPILDGTYGIDFIVVDKAGNRLSKSFSKSYIIDRTAPTFDVQVPSGWAKSKRVKVVNIVDANLSHSVYLAEGVYTGADYVGSFRSTTSNELEWMQDVSTDQISLTLTDAAGNYTTKVVNVTGLDGYRPNSPTILLDSLLWSKAGLGFKLVDNGDTGLVANRSGVEKMQYSFDQVTWVDYSVGASLPEHLKGMVDVYARSIDRAGNISNVVSVVAKIDDTPPVFESIRIEEIGGKNFLVASAVDIHSGLATSPYRFEKRIEGVRGYGSLRTWGTSSSVEIVDDVPNALYVFRSFVRDLNGNEAVSGEVGYVSVPKVTSYIDPKKSNNVTFTLDRALDVDDGVAVEIYRSGKLLSTIVSGDTFEDFNLSYEKAYNYEFVAVADFGGSKLRSVPLKVGIETGIPELLFELERGEIRKTVFSDVVSVAGKLTYRSGGLFDVVVVDSVGNKLVSTKVEVYAFEPSKFVLEVDTGSLPDRRIKIDMIQGGELALGDVMEYDILDAKLVSEDIGSSLTQYMYN